MVRAPSLAQLIDRGFLFARLVCAFRRGGGWCDVASPALPARSGPPAATGRVCVGPIRTNRAAGYRALGPPASTPVWLWWSYRLLVRHHPSGGEMHDERGACQSRHGGNEHFEPARTRPGLPSSFRASGRIQLYVRPI
jgi:hypothetical protein